MAKAHEKPADKSAEAKPQAGPVPADLPGVPSRGPNVPGAPAVTPHVGKNIADIAESQAHPPEVPFGDTPIDPREVSLVNRDNFPGGGNPESPQFQAAMQQARGDSRVRAEGFTPMRSEPLFTVTISFLNFQEGQHVTLSQVVKAGADPEHLLGNGALKPLNAGGVALRGLVSEHGLPHVDPVSHNQALTAVREQVADEYRDQIAKLQRERDQLKRAAVEPSVQADEHAAELEKIKKGATEEAARSSKLEVENDDLKEANKALQEEIAKLRAGKDVKPE